MSYWITYVLVFITILALGPFITIWSINQLFELNILHTFYNYLAVWGLLFVASATLAPSRK